MPEQTADIAVAIRFKGRLLPARLILRAKSKEAKAAEVERIEQKQHRNRRVGDPRSLAAAGFVIVVTTLDANVCDADEVLALYRTRWQIENRVKEQQLWLFADRTSSATMRANQLRLYFSAFAGILVTILRRVGLRGTDLATARIDTIRSRLLKLAGRIRVTVRRVWLSFASVFPLQGVFEQALANLRAAPVRDPPG